MVVCIELRIPLFLVGKPGSSKSLAKAIVADVMQGKSSRSDFFKHFKQTHMLSFQCSPLSTAEGIVSTFKQSAKIQKEKNLDTFVATVVLDEIGLAEDSSRMPLKTLHPLLEDGCEANEAREPHKKVSFVGISNWALDPAKMNRGISVQREVPETKELIDTAEGICQNSSKVHNLIKPVLKSLTTSYLKVFEEARQEREFFGLRDFYSLVKMVYSFAENNTETPCWHQLEHCIRRNFGGLDSIDAVEIFGRHIENVRLDERRHEGDPSCTPFDLIKAGLFGNQSDSRYLLLLTENYEALGILQEQILQNHKVQTIFGSSFPRDQEYTKVCRNINRIKVCMETGQTVILLNLENLYESLYDALNQYYAKFGGERYVDLGLGSHRVKCRVHKNFRLVVVAEKTTVYDKFPIPLINRLEKHFLTQNNIMSEDQAKMSEKLKKWAEQLIQKSTSYSYSTIDKHTVTVEDAFMGYHSDAAASVVMKVWTDFSTEEEEMKFIECKKALLWCCSPEIILQIENRQLFTEKEFAQTTYFEDQQHTDIFKYVNENITNRTKPLFAQITTHSALLTEDAKRCFTHDTRLLHLQSFDTEQQFCKEIRSFSQKAEDETRILIIQSDSQIANRSLVKCAQYCVDDNLPKDLVNFHVIFIIQLDRISQQRFTGYQGGKWHCLHIDDLHPTKDFGATLMQMQHLSMADLFRRSDYRCEISEEPITPNDIQPEGKTSPVFTDQYIISQITARVQAAVGRVSDDKNLFGRPADRVSILLRLLNDAEGEFSQGIIRLISYLIKQKEEKMGIYFAEKWLAKEACKPDNINKAGTFRRAWCQYLEEKITPILAGIIAHIDKNLNLNIIVESTDWKKSVWLKILGRPSVCGLKYTDLISTEKMEELNEFVVRNTGYGRQSFQAIFPFSWLFYDLTETALHTSVREDPSLTGEEIVKHTVHVIEKNELFKILDRFVVSKEEMFSSYMSDFIVMTYGPKDKDIFEILYDILSSALKQRGFHVEDLDISFIIAVVHYIHTIAQYRIQHFLEIIYLKPDVLRAIVDMKAENTGHCLLNKNYMTEDVLGLCAFMEMMTPHTGKLDNPDGRRDWYKETCRCLPVAEKILDFSSSTKTVKGLEYHDACRDQLTQIRCLWTKIVTITLFVEHFSPADESTAALYQSLKWQILWHLLKEDVDLHNLDSLEKVEKFLKLINKAVLHKLLGEVASCTQCNTKFESAPVKLPCGNKICTECMIDMQEDGEKHCRRCERENPDNFNAAASNRESSRQLKTFHRHCDSFLMAMVSKLCFSSNTAPSEDVVHRLMEYITVKKTARTGELNVHRVKTKPMSLFIHEIDRTPICRLFFLKLLIRQSAEYTSSYLHDFFEDAKQLIEQTSRRTSKVNKSSLVEFSALVSYCLEDVYYENASDFTDQCIQEIDAATKSLKAAAEYFRQRDKDEISVIEQLENLVRCRYGLVVAAKYLHHFFISKSLNMSEEFRSLVEAIRNVIKIETTMMWPKMFLLKQICRKYGTDCYEEIMSNDQYKWIGLERKRQMVPDRYVIYGTDYTNVLQTLRLVDLGDDIKTLHRSLKKINKKRQEFIFLMVLQNTVSTFENEKTKQKLDEFIKGNDKFQLKNVALEFLSTSEEQKNQYIGVTTTNHIESKNLESLLYHWLIVLNSASKGGLLQPLYTLLVDPSSMEGVFLPTMPEETLADISMVIKAMITRADQVTVYRCPNGHAYLIGECGRPWGVSRCNECNAEIGGVRHKAADGNTIDDGHDRSKTGHILGQADQRPLEAIPERSMSPSVCAIIRMMTHMSMMLGAKQNPEGVANLINPPINEDVEVYFTCHLQKDVAVLQKALQKSSDDVYLLIHLICQHLLYNLPTGGGIHLLDTKESRKNWEDEVSAIISQILQSMEGRLANANQTIVENSSSDESNLLKILYEVDSPAENTGLQNLETNPILWRYRERITVEHFLRQFQLKVIDQDNQRDAQTFQLIRLFMQEKYCLQVLQFLPDIIKLQYTLVMTFCRKVDRSGAKRLTIGTVLNECFGGNDEIRLQFENLIRTWETLKEKLISHVCHLRDGGRLVIPDEFHNMKMDKSTKLDFILPSVKGPGVCSYIMTEYLLRKHNSCLESYCLLTNQRFEDVPVVEIKDISSYHLIAFHLEKDILPLVLSNCNYSFQLDKSEPEEIYDFGGFENQLKDTVFTRKSRIKTEGHIIPIDAMLFKADSSNAVVFSALRNKIPQVSLKLVLKHQLCEEIQKLPDICDSLNNLDIANSFLKSLGGDPEANLHQFMSGTLKMKTTIFSQTARNECQFKHLQCLWLTLSFEKDKRLAASNKESFVDLDDEVKKEIEDNDAEYFRQTYQQYGVDKLNVLLHVIYDSILLRIAQTKDPEDDVDYRAMRLRDILIGEFDSPPYTEPPTELIQLNIEMFNDWPESVLGSQAIQVWKLLLEVYMKKEREL
ncbi:E3 ubiquitin-protein ligase RNF213 [Patella vulgata]|uniref:E3 ubiquitin-protein ligase RNF213 n=1 Tax=Patella vulgata TaxID=6465 RepID=UPI0024A98994|nr:E3 ubiquitin-protein ligase RNF213 [Patella vulgata]